MVLYETGMAIFQTVLSSSFGKLWQGAVVYDKSRSAQMVSRARNLQKNKTNTFKSRAVVKTKRQKVKMKKDLK